MAPKNMHTDVAQGNGIVYDGVARGNDVEHGGTTGAALFQGLKFWITIRVPMRKELVRMVEDNGGEVVKLEKQADILIADHARKDVPSGSLSWRFIEQSVRNGRLENIDSHAIKPATSARRFAGSSDTNGSARPPRGVRTPFTGEDDDMLMKFVARQEGMRAPVGGNKIYQDFASEHPHHSWQSWRDRWLKKLKFLPRPEINDENPDDDQDDGENVPEDEAQGASRALTANRKPPPNAITIKTGRTGAKVNFSKEDDELLANHVKEDIRPRRHRVTDPWAFRHQAPSEEDDDEDENLMSLASGSDDEAEGPRRGPTPVLDLQKLQESNRRHERSDRVFMAIRTIQRYWRAYISRRALSSEICRLSITALQAAAKGALTRIALKHDEDDNDGTGPEEQTPSRYPTRGETTERTGSQLFYSDLSDFIEVTNQKITFWPTVQARVLNLWELWHAVTVQEHPPDMRNWEDIAESLDFDWISYPWVTTELKHCFESNLGAFERALNGFDADDADDADEAAEAGHADDDDPELVGDAVGDAEFGEGAPTYVPATSLEGHRDGPSGTVESAFASSPPRLHGYGSKRGFETHLEAESHPTSSPRKRTKYDSDGEIPSTPNEKSGTSYLQPRNNPGISPDGISPNQANLARVNGLIEALMEELPTLQELTAPRQTPTQPEPFSPATLISRTTPSRQSRPQPRLVDPIPLSFPDRITRTSAPEPRDGANDATKAGRTTAAQRASLPTQYHPDRAAAIRRSSRAANTTPARRSMPPSSLGPAWRDVSPAARSSFSPPRTSASARLRLISRPQEPAGPPTGPVHPNAPSPHNTPDSRSSLLASIDRFMSMGYPKDIVIQGLKATSMAPGEAGVVMESLMAGQGIPSRHEGVWTSRDDEGLGMVDNTDLAKHTRDPHEVDKKRRALRELKRLRHKHGQRRVEERLDFLRAWNAG